MRIGLGMGLWRGQIVARRWDADALAYIAQVEAADGQPLEPKVKLAMNQFVKQCKRDASPVAGVSNWQAMKATCLLAGARTLAGALVPLRGPAPTNYNFVSGDYNPVTGLKGNGSNKYLNLNINNNSVPEDNRHMAVYDYDIDTEGPNGVYIAAGGANAGSSYILHRTVPDRDIAYRLSSSVYQSLVVDTHFIGISRDPSASTRVNFVNDEGETSVTLTSESTYAADVMLFRRNDGNYTTTRLSFSSFGEAIDLTALRTAVNAYMEAIA